MSQAIFTPIFSFLRKLNNLFDIWILLISLKSTKKLMKVIKNHEVFPHFWGKIGILMTLRGGLFLDTTTDKVLFLLEHGF